MEVGDLHDKLHGIVEHQQCTLSHRFRFAQLLKAMLIEILDEGQAFRFKRPHFRYPHCSRFRQMVAGCQQYT